MVLVETLAEHYMLLVLIPFLIMILALDAALTTANQTLIEAETQWQGIAEERDALVAQSVDLNTLATSKYIGYTIRDIVVWKSIFA